jgi:hypothetical protein
VRRSEIKERLMDAAGRMVKFVRTLAPWEQAKVAGINRPLPQSPD